MSYKRLLTVLTLVSVTLIFSPLTGCVNKPVSAASSAKVTKADFINLVEADPQQRIQSLAKIEQNWNDSFTPLLLEIVHISRNQGDFEKIFQILKKETGQNFGYDSKRWFEWAWSQDLEFPSFYPEFKSNLYGRIDPKFLKYFSSDRQSKIRLDEVRWGGVRQDGIPPLRQPTMISVAEASYLADSDVVFAIQVNGDSRAYPKRILAWHEMFVDTVGGISVTGVYCTLCGSMILYENEYKGKEYKLGTSGFLYRSNKLMYDKDTQSLWNTLWGKPAIGPLVGKGIRLNRRSAVTSTWGEWKKRHPETTVLSLNTGHRRDYSEGAAYRDYFATDKLMFNVPKLDNRLKNKDEVLSLIFDEEPNQPLAISADFLKANPTYHKKLGTMSFVVLTDASGANRVYESKEITFKSWDQKSTAMDATGKKWTLSEESLSSDSGQVLKRLPAHRAFWFGWFSAYPETELVY